MRNKTICILCDHPFWLEPLGCGSLMRARYDFLRKHLGKVLVLFITPSDLQCPLEGGTLKLTGPFAQQQVDAITTFLKANAVDIAYFSYDQFGFVADKLDCFSMVEIHDVLHLRQAQFERFGYKAPHEVDKTTELASLARYDAVISLNLREVDYLKENGIGNAFYLPPNIGYISIKKKSEGLAAGIIGSMAVPNVDGIQHCFEYIQDIPNLIFAGPLCGMIETNYPARKTIRMLGIVNDVADFYSLIDVALSPVRFGGGLKIKVFEALAYGKPVLSSTHGVDGFPSGIEAVVLVEDDFTKWNTALVKQAAEIKEDVIRQYFLDNFSENKCADIFKKIIQ